jgi:hypothetical protein
MRFKKIVPEMICLNPANRQNILGLKRQKIGIGFAYPSTCYFFMFATEKTDALRSVQEFGFRASQKQTLSSTVCCAPSMNDTFSSAFLKGGIHDLQSIFSRKLISGEDSLFRKHIGGEKQLRRCLAGILLT